MAGYLVSSLTLEHLPYRQGSGTRIFFCSTKMLFITVKRTSIIRYDRLNSNCHFLRATYVAGRDKHYGHNKPEPLLHLLN